MENILNKEPVQRVQKKLDEYNKDFKAIVLNSSARTSKEAAESLNTDVAICMVIKESYPDITVDMILPKEITLERLKKNSVNFILGYDCINQML